MTYIPYMLCMNLIIPQSSIVILVSNNKQHRRAHFLNYFQMFQSSCSIDIKYFPFDVQTCQLKFVAWSYSKAEVSTQTDGFVTVFTVFIRTVMPKLTV